LGTTLEDKQLNLMEWASLLLNSGDLRDKLMGVETFLDMPQSRTIDIPDFPARPKNLQFTQDKGRFPQSFKSASARGIGLHYFANHELLAIELMALALLKFPDAPKSFRLGIAATIREEQTHLSLYLNRMRELSVDFGDVGVNGFFWSTISSMSSPFDYVTRMSLTFEQANLDHALHYKNLFLELGDVESASIMERVYQEEIGHVKFGVKWFNEFRENQDSFWHEYESALTLPLSPSRAKGKVFSEETRILAGFDFDYIRELSIYGRSKGRLPVVYELNATCEEYLKNPTFQKSGYLAQLEADLGSLLMFMARPGDIVSLESPPTREFIDYWAKLGAPLVEFLNDIPSDRKIDCWHPWGKTNQFQDEKTLGVKRGTEFLYGKDFGIQLDQTLRELLDHSWIEKESGRSALDSEPAIFLHLNKLMDMGVKDFVLKAKFGASGRGHKKINLAEVNSVELHSWIKNHLRFGPISVEPWLNRIADFSIQVDLRKFKAKSFKGVTRLLNSQLGKYEGHILRGLFYGLSKSTLHKIYSENLQSVFYEIARIVTGELEKHQFDGVAGIDLFLYEKDSHIYLCPVCELNPRITMGYIALELERYFKVGKPLVWRHSAIKNLSTEFIKSLIDLSNPQVIPTTPIHKQSLIATWIEPLVAENGIN
jgi:uncharacterized ferritin-like protein (DUF455 family)